jgi:hypothetical protein
MTQAVVSAIPIESRLVPNCLESIIDIKVRGAVLNIFQKLIDWFFGNFYLPYDSLYQGKMTRVHLFKDGLVKLYDTSKQGIGRIEKEFLTIHMRKVFFNRNPNIASIFSREVGTDYVVIKDDERQRPGWFQIIEQAIPQQGRPRPMEKVWSVNTNRFGKIPNTYLVEQPRALLN